MAQALAAARVQELRDHAAAAALGPGGTAPQESPGTSFQAAVATLSTRGAPGRRAARLVRRAGAALPVITEQATGKPVGLVSHAGRLPGTQVLDHLRLVARGLHAIAIPAQLVTVDADYTMIGGTLYPASAAAWDRLGRLAEELLWYAGRLGQAGGPAPRPRDVVEAWCVSG